MIGFSKWTAVVGVSMALCLAGCSKEPDGNLPDGHSMNDGHDHSHDGHDHSHDGHDHGTEKAEMPPPSPELKKVVLTEGAPAQFEGVAQAKATAETGKDVTVEGRLKDFVVGKAAFTMVDGEIKACGEDCSTPWDYCCINPSVLSKNSATVKLLDADGNLLSGNLQGVNNIDHLTTVVVVGKADKDAQGNLTISAANVYFK